MTLYDFAIETSSDPKLKKIAMAIPSEVDEICIDECFQGMEIHLTLLESIRAKNALMALEAYLRFQASVNNRRIFSSGQMSQA